jgi:hypothetical protein
MIDKNYKPEIVSVYVLYKDCATGKGGYYEEAYLSEKVAKRYAKELEEEWLSYEPREVVAEIIPGNRCIVDRYVYDLNIETYEELLKNSVMEKLTMDEKVALGIDLKV